MWCFVLFFIWTVWAYKYRHCLFSIPYNSKHISFVRNSLVKNLCTVSHRRIFYHSTKTVNKYFSWNMTKLNSRYWFLCVCVCMCVREYVLQRDLVVYTLCAYVRSSFPFNFVLSDQSQCRKPYTVHGRFFSA